ncbi:MAG: hypothetical protein ACR2PR_06040 [Pseudohongiellaceae bacterium]
MGVSAALLAVSLVATGAQVISQRRAAKQARLDAKAQADQEKLRLQGELIDRRRKFIDQQSANIAASGASGVDPFQGSNAEITAEGFRRFNLESLSAEVSGTERQRQINRGGRLRARELNAQSLGTVAGTASSLQSSGVFE